jgi:serine phosphatase RsbU (regulator of sigma subunit)
LGFSKKGEYEDSVIQIKEKDRIYLTTDGVIDSRSKTHESFGEERLFQLITNLKDNNAPLDVIKEKCDKFTDSEYDDDISLILIEAK